MTEVFEIYTSILVIYILVVYLIVLVCVKWNNDNYVSCISGHLNCIFMAPLKFNIDVKGRKVDTYDIKWIHMIEVDKYML